MASTMQRDRTPITIVIADDDADDRMLIEDAFEENDVQNPLHFVEDGEQLLQYLKREGDFTEHKSQPLPGLILLDLNMPKMDGRTALAEIRQHDLLCRIPVVILTTSKADEDVIRTYDMKANSFITKPVTFEGLVRVVRAISEFWIGIAALPPECQSKVV